MMGIIEESNTAIEELEGAVLDAALIAGAQKAEHYEIASYGTLAQFAETLGHTRAKDLLGATLEEEKAADEKLNVIATSQVNHDALNGDEDEDDSGMSMPGTMRRAVSAVGLASEQSRRRTSATARGRRATKKR